jgi:hypothetical protein
VLIPAAGGSAWDWHRIVPELQGRGQDVVAVTLPAGDESAGLTKYADAVIDAVGDRSGVILVAQWMGTFTAPLVCERVPDCAVLVLCALRDSRGRGIGRGIECHCELLLGLVFIAVGLATLVSRRRSTRFSVRRARSTEDALGPFAHAIPRLGVETREKAIARWTVAWACVWIASGVSVLAEGF